MKEPMTECKEKTNLQDKKTKKKENNVIRSRSSHGSTVFSGSVCCAETADLLRVDDSDRMEDAEQSYSGQGGKTRTNTEKTWGVFGKADVLTQEDKLHSIEESDEYPDQLKELAEKIVRQLILSMIIRK